MLKTFIPTVPHLMAPPGWGCQYYYLKCLLVPPSESVTYWPTDWPLTLTLTKSEHTNSKVRQSISQKFFWNKREDGDLDIFHQVPHPKCRPQSYFSISCNIKMGALKGYAGGRTSQKLYAKYIKYLYLIFKGYAGGGTSSKTSQKISSQNWNEWKSSQVWVHLWPIF